MNYFNLLVQVSTVVVVIVIGVYTTNHLIGDRICCCDKLYGGGNWIFNETTGTGKYKDYIGQVWMCVPKENVSDRKWTIKPHKQKN